MALTLNNSFLKPKFPVFSTSTNSFLKPKFPVLRSQNKFRTTMSLKVKETFYIGHGSPHLLFLESMPVRQFFESWRQKIYSERPTSILIISAHWHTDEPTLTAVDACDTIHDFDGFDDLPDFLYQMKYPAPGAPATAERVQQFLTNSGFDQVHLDKKRGLDHGAWVPLRYMYPDSDIPICQLSVQPHKDARHHYNIGRALAPLKEEGVLIIGSGKVTHNLKEIDFSAEEILPWATEFDNWVEQALITGRYEDVNNYEKIAPYAKRAHPIVPDHLYPLHVAMGVAGEGSKAELIHRSWAAGSISFASYKFSGTS